MKIIVLLLLLLAPLHARADGADFASLEKCVDELQSLHAWYAKRLPAELLSSDRKLHRMIAGISFQKENLEMLRKRGESSALDRHLVENAVEGCRLYSANFRSRLTWFLWFTATLGVFLAAFALHVVVNAMSATPRPSSPAEAPPAGDLPADHPRRESEDSSRRLSSRRD